MEGTGGGPDLLKQKMKVVEAEEESEEDVVDSEDDDETIARIQRAHYAQAAAMSSRRRATPRARPMSQKRKMEAVKTFQDFTKKLKKDTGISIRGLVGNNLLELSELSSDESETESDGLSEEEFTVNPKAVEELNQDNESYIDPETGDFVEAKKKEYKEKLSLVDFKPPNNTEVKAEPLEEPKTLSISDIIDEGDLDLTKNVEISEVEGSDLCQEKSAEELLNMKQEDSSQDFDITDKLKEMGEISVKPMKKEEESETPLEADKKQQNEDEEEKKPVNPNALNVRRNIREVMDEKNLDASTLAAQRQESERLARVQEQQRIIREVQRQIALNRQNKIHQKTLSLLQGGSSLLKKALPGQKLNFQNTVMMKVPPGEVKRTTAKQGQLEVTRLPKPTTSGAQKPDKKEVVEIVDSSSGEESSSSSSDSDDCIMLSDSEVPPSPEAEEDPNNSGLHVNDTYNIPDEQGRVLINIGHPESEEDIFLAPQIARVIKPHQIGGVRFLFDNIIESTERFSTSTGFGCILAHSMGLGKTLQIVCFCDIFLRHTSSKTVLCIMPINTLQNWVAEFNMWLPLDASTSPLSAHGEVRSRNFPIYVLNDSHKTLQMRAKVVKDWTTAGGVLMIGYELYRLLSMKKDKKPRKKKKAELKAEAEREKKEKEKEDEKKVSEMGNEDTQSSDITNQSKMSEDCKPDGDGDCTSKPDDKEDKTELSQANEDKKLLDEMYEALVKPGPDLVICDEGHRIKNSHSNISYALKQMRTKRRVVLTGYPLQNNLLEYWCMVDFVRPNYLGSKTEFCNMFERPIQNGQCIDSTPQDIRLMRYRAHVLHSLLVGFVQRRSHAVLQSTLPQKEEYVLLIRMTPLQRKLYDRFMNEVVRSTSVPNPLKAFAICCKIWNHPDVLYNFLRKRSEVNAAIEEDLDLEELGGVTKTGRAKASKAQPGRRPGKPRGAAKKPAATIPPNTTTAQAPLRQDPSTYGNAPYPPNGPQYGQQGYRPDQPGSFPPYPNYPNSSGYYPPNQGYNQNYDSNYYQQQPPYANNYPNQYPPNNQEGYNQNYWGNGSYYGNQGYYNNPQYPQNSQTPHDYRNNPSGPQYPNNQNPPEYRGNPPDYNNPQNYPPDYNASSSDQTYTGNAGQPYPSQESYANQRPPYQGYNTQPNYADYNPNSSGSFPPNNSNSQEYSSQPGPYGPAPYNNNAPPYGPTQGPYNQYDNTHSQNYPGYPDNMPPIPVANNVPNMSVKTEPHSQNSFPTNEIKTEANMPLSVPPNMGQNVTPVMPHNNMTSALPQNLPPIAQNMPPALHQNLPPSENTAPPSHYGNTAYQGYPPNAPPYPNAQANDNDANYQNPYPNFPPHLETKPPLCSASSGSPVTSWPITELKTEVDRLKAEEKTEIKSESDGEVKIADLDTKKIVKDESKKVFPSGTPPVKDIKLDPAKQTENNSKQGAKSDKSESEEEVPKKAKRGRPRASDTKKGDKAKGKSKAKPKGRKDRKTSKEKNNDESDSEESEKEEKLNREEELALVKKAEEMTYDWATEILKDYIPGIIENSAKMELLFYILNESINMGDRLLLFSQSLFTLNLIEDFLERNYIPGTNSLWERNTNYYRLDGSTHALEREKLINEFNTNPHIYLFLVSTRAGSLGINLVGANRVIVFDASWNPCHDTQAVCRVYRYGQKKPCFVYRFVMDCCLEKKIYDRQINKQGMADRVVDECNPDAVLSMKEITNLCFDNDEKESEVKDLSEYKDKYLDVLMQGIITKHSNLLSKEPFQHESLLVDRKEKKLSSAEKRLAQRGYEMEKKAALAPKPTPAYRTVRTADGSLVQRPVASVRPMQHGARWIPADVWRRQGMTAQEMTLPLDVVIPTNSAEKTNIVLKAGQRVMVLKSPKGIYMQLESGKIIAIKTSFKGLAGQKGENKDGPIGKKVLASRPSAAAIPGSLKNNSAITITSKTGPRPGFQRVVNRPGMMGHKMRPMIPGQKLAEIRNRLGEIKAYNAMRARSPVHGRMIRPALPGSVSITKIPREKKKPDDNSESSNKMEFDSEEDTQVLDSDEEANKPVNKTNERKPSSNSTESKKDKTTYENKKFQRAPQADSSDQTPSNTRKYEQAESKIESQTPIVLTTDEKLPPEDSFENRTSDENSVDYSKPFDMSQCDSNSGNRPGDRIERKINLLKNYRHQRVVNRPPSESSLSQLERTASALNKESMPDFRKNLDDITQSYSPTNEDRNSKSKKKKSPSKVEGSESQVVEVVRQPAMSHSVSNLLGPSGPQKRPVDMAQNTAPVAPIENPLSRMSRGMTQEGLNMPSKPPLNMSHGLMSAGVPSEMGLDMSKSSVNVPPSIPPSPLNVPPQAYPGPTTPPEGHYAQYPPGYGMGYGAYPSPYYGGYGAGAGYFPPYAAPAGFPPPAPAPAPPPDYMPPNQQW